MRTFEKGGRKIDGGELKVPIPDFLGVVANSIDHCYQLPPIVSPKDPALS